MWHEPANRLALFELVATGALRRRGQSARAFDELIALGWAVQGRRHDLAVAAPVHEANAASLLERIWPDWRQAVLVLEREGLRPDAAGWAALEARERIEGGGASPLPRRINQRTAAARFAAHSKAPLGPAQLDALGEASVTSDGIVRMRPCAGMRIRGTKQAEDATAIAALLGEVAISERALLDGVTVEGIERGLLLVENLGAFVDLEAPPGVAVAHVPGWDTATVRLLLERTTDLPVVHFGDLDPAGVRMVQHLRGIRAGLGWLVPGFWAEYVERHGLPCRWPEVLPGEPMPALVRRLMAEGLWLEQEHIVLDERLAPAIDDAFRSIRGETSDANVGSFRS